MNKPWKNHWNKSWLPGILAALAVAAFLSPFASADPDGLERVAEDLGFLDRAAELHWAPVPDYLFPGVGHEGFATSLAGILGTILTFAVMYVLGKWLTARKQP